LKYLREMRMSEKETPADFILDGLREGDKGDDEKLDELIKQRYKKIEDRVKIDKEEIIMITTPPSSNNSVIEDFWNYTYSVLNNHWIPTEYLNLNKEDMDG